jgi:hypothetical protein
VALRRPAAAGEGCQTHQEEMKRNFTRNLGDSMDQVWDDLIKYESRDFVEKVYLAKHGRSPSLKKLNEIIANFIQAREYFVNADAASITVKPLLQYYGVIALSRGMILTTSSEKDAASLRPSHGLREVNWRSTLSKGTNKFGDLIVQVQNGTFIELLGVTENSSYFRDKSYGISRKFGYTLPLLKAKLTFHDVVSGLADLHKEYEVWKGIPFPSAELVNVKKLENRESYSFEFRQYVTDETISKIFPVQKDLVSLQREETKLIVIVPASQSVMVSQYSNGAFGMGDVHVVAPSHQNICLSMVGLYFASSFFLANAVRYFPSTWVSLGRQGKGDIVFPLINKMINLIQVMFPQIILDYLNSPYNFETKASLEAKNSD